jgi:hypothetical protein
MYVCLVLCSCISCTILPKFPPKILRKFVPRKRRVQYKYIYIYIYTYIYIYIYICSIHCAFYNIFENIFFDRSHTSPKTIRIGLHRRPASIEEKDVFKIYFIDFIAGKNVFSPSVICEYHHRILLNFYMYSSPACRRKSGSYKNGSTAIRRTPVCRTPVRRTPVRRTLIKHQFVEPQFIELFFR